MPIETPSEPSLDEILASIRKIIAEDAPVVAQSALAQAPVWSPTPAPMPADGVEAEEDVLVLTRVAARAEAPPSPPVQSYEAPSSPDAVLATPEATPEPRDQVVEVVSAVREEESAVSPSDPYAPSEAPVSAAAAAFDRLESVIAEPAAPPPPSPAASIAMPAPGRTLEDVIRELMEPVIREWIDANLPALVEAKVDEEIARIMALRKVR